MSELKHCPKCGKPVEKEIDWPLFGVGGAIHRVVRIMCDCDIAEKQATEERLAREDRERQLKTLQNMSLMDSRLAMASFDSYTVTQENAKMLKVCKNYVANFSDMKANGQGLMLLGDVGVGKSYTAACVANSLMSDYHSVVMTSFVRMLTDLSLDEIGEYTLNLNNAELVIIDDFGAERSTDFALEKIYNMIDLRYRSKKPLMITTNNKWSDMQNCQDIRYARIYDRVIEMCYPVNVTGMSFRKREVVNKSGRLKELLEA